MTDENPFATDAAPKQEVFQPSDVFGSDFSAAPAPAPAAAPPTLEFTNSGSAQYTPPSVPPISPKPSAPAATIDFTSITAPPQTATGGSAILSGSDVEPAGAPGQPQQPGQTGVDVQQAEQGAPVERKWYHMFYKISWYQPFFDVDTGDVLARMLYAVLPVRRKGFVDMVRPRADLYGPFWITTTLLFLLSAASNWASFLSAWRAGLSQAWEIDFTRVYVACGVMYGYVALVPIALWVAQKWWVKAQLSLVECWCLYGYAMTALLAAIPVCLVPSTPIRWAALGAGFAITLITLVVALATAMFSANKFKALIIIAVAILLQVGLFLTYKLYFFGGAKVSAASSVAPR